MTKNIFKIFIMSFLSNYVFVSKVHAKPSDAYIEIAITEAAEKAHVPVDLLRGICTIESNLKDDAFVYNDGGDNNHAYGICQVLRKTAEKFVGKDKKCERDFRNLDKNYKECKLFGPKVNALAAAMYLREQMDRYNNHLHKAAAAYNSGSIKKCSKGWVTNKQGKKLQRCKHGDILNRYYLKKLDSVLSPESDLKNQFANAEFKFNKSSET